MIDIAALTSTTLSSVLAYLGSNAVEAADETAKAAGGKATDWLRSKFRAASDQKALKQLEANPDSQGAQMKVHGALLSRLQEEPSLAEELKGLLLATGILTRGTQRIRTTGDFNISTQVVGSGNITKIRRE